MSKPKIAQRMFDKIDLSGECWWWTGGITPQGYGQYWLEGTNVGAHRAVYEVMVGKIPDGMWIDHLCGNRSCVNINHLEPVTTKENAQRRHHIPGKARAPKEGKQKLCKRGHDLRDSYQYGTGPRNCRLCASVRHARRLRNAA